MNIMKILTHGIWFYTLTFPCLQAVNAEPVNIKSTIEGTLTGSFKCAQYSDNYSDKGNTYDISPATFTINVDSNGPSSLAIDTGYFKFFGAASAIGPQDLISQGTVSYLANGAITFKKDVMDTQSDHIEGLTGTSPAAMQVFLVYTINGPETPTPDKWCTDNKIQVGFATSDITFGRCIKFTVDAFPSGYSCSVTP